MELREEPISISEIGIGGGWKAVADVDYYDL